MPEVGERAPDIALSGTQGEMRLSDLWSRGKVVLAFYAEDGTPACLNQISMLRDDYDMVRELGADIVAVSADSIESHHDFVERIGGIPFALISDVALEGAAAYGVVDEAGNRSRRSVFVIDRGGLILHAERWFQPGNPAQYEAIFRALGMEA